MIGDLLTNPVFLTVGTLAAIVATLAIFKKLFKVTFIILLLFVVFAITIVYTGEDPKDLTKKAKASMKEIERDAKDVKKVVEIPICIDEEFSLDLSRISKKLNIDENDVIKVFLSKEYFCYMTGFIAGMPFMGDINKNLRLNRLETPRVKVPKGSVGITEQFCNVYTYDSPGGWNVIGNTPSKIFDKFNFNNPLKIKPGDKVIFYQINKKKYLNWNE